MTIFTVHGPYDVPVHEGKVSRTITEDQAREFWKLHHDLAMRKGCYVFAIRAGRGIKPYWVGRATKTFRQEVFAPHKLSKYQKALVDYAKGTPIMFLLTLPNQKGKPNLTGIKDLEAFLIQVGVSRNPDLLNTVGTGAENWSISGVLRSNAGQPSKAAQTFRKLMGL